VTQRRHQGDLLAAGVLIGAGLGGFLDGIVLHQLLQWHHMLSSKVPPTDLWSVKFNMTWDGLFHAATWLMTAAGILLMWRAGQRREQPWSGAAFAGAVALGWGLFNFVEGLVDHQLLGIHHVHPGAGQLAWDLGFVVMGALLCLGGALAIRSGRVHAGGQRVLIRPPSMT
jgi:uncharacterized membrane protein